MKIYDYDYGNKVSSQNLNNCLGFVGVRSKKELFRSTDNSATTGEYNATELVADNFIATRVVASACVILNILLG